jgi:hypothetical protein
MQYGAPCACRTRKQVPYNCTPVAGGPPAPGRRGSSDQFSKPSADLLKSQALKSTRHSGSDYFKVLPISTQQDNVVPLFFLRRDLFFRTRSLLFTCISWTSLWYLAKVVSSFDYVAAACF